MPGAPEITRLVRQLESSPQLRKAAQGRLRVLPLHGALPSHAQVHFAPVILSQQKFLKTIWWKRDCKLVMC